MLTLGLIDKVILCANPPRRARVTLEVTSWLEPQIGAWSAAYICTELTGGKRMASQKLTRRLYIVIGVVVFLIGGLYVIYRLSFDPYRGTIKTAVDSKDLSATLTKEEASADLAYLVDKLEKRHPACIAGLPDEVQAQYEKELIALTDDVTVLQLWQASARVLARMKDAHTAVRHRTSDYQRLPVGLEMSDGRLLCISEGYDNAEITRINGIPVDELYRRFLTQFSYELESYASYCFSNYIREPKYLEFVGVDTASGINLAFSNEKGEWEQSMAFELPVEDATSAELPFVAYQIDEENSLGIFTLRSCQINDLYRETLKNFFTEVKELSISHVAVDLRNNGGGNSQVINEFLRYLDVHRYAVVGRMDVRYGPVLWQFKRRITKNRPFEDLLFTGKLFALTSTKTFSSAAMFAVTLLDNNLAKIIGEIPGNMPASYGDILAFQTPNAKLFFTISHKYFERIDGMKADLPLIPHYGVKAAGAIDKLYEIIE